MIIDNETSNKIESLISDGWEFYLHYGNHETYCDKNMPQINWEADFTRKLKNGKWDNHKCGYGIEPTEAINIAIYNVLNGIKI